MQLFADLRDSGGDEPAFFVQHADFDGALPAALDLANVLRNSKIRQRAG
jgi:hypothetical protein